MTIAVDISSWGPADGSGDFLTVLMKRMATACPNDRFLFISNQPVPFTNPGESASNTKVLLLSPSSWMLAKKNWYTRKLPALLKKNKAAVFFSAHRLCKPVPGLLQYFVVSDLSFLQPAAGIKKRQLAGLKKQLQQSLHQSDAVITVSAYLQEKLQSFVAGSSAAIQVIAGGKEPAESVSDSDKQRIRQQYTGGKNYFIYTGPVDPAHNVVNLLKGYSIFKKRQKSDWKLVLTGSFSPGAKNFQVELESYKYREELVLVQPADPKELVSLLSAAYGLLYPSVWQGYGDWIPEALQQGVPVIAAGKDALQEIAGEAVLYTDSTEPVPIADQVMLLYKDEALRSRLIGQSITIAAAWDWNTAVNRLLQDLQQRVQ